MNPPDLLPSDAESGSNDLETTTTNTLEQPEASQTTKSLDAPPSDPTATIKTEQNGHNGDGSHDGLGNDAVETSLRPDPLPSKKRRESEAELQSATPEPAHNHHHPNKKRKRGASPPWQFEVAAVSTLKSTDGRRLSARHSNVGTPGLSGSEADTVTAKSAKSRGRSQSQSTTIANSRPPSPPWKKFEAQGPTSIIVDGQRKSGRANKELVAGPKRVSPRSKKQVDKLGADTISVKRNAETKPLGSKSMGGSSRRSETEPKDAKSKASTESKKQAIADAKKQVNGLDRPSTSDASERKIADLKAQIAALKPTRSFTTPSKTEVVVTNGTKGSTAKSKTKVKHETGEQGGSLRRKIHRASDASIGSPERSKPSPKLKLKVAPRRVIPPPNPQAQVPSPSQVSIWKLLEDLELQERLALSAENERGPKSVEELAEAEEKDVARESASRRRLLEAARPGGALSAENLSLFRDDYQPEPPPQYGHHDHLTAHALYLRTLQIREKTSHRALAKKLAQEAVEKWKIRNGPTEEDLIAERNKIIDHVKKQIVVDMRAKWEMVEAHVKDLKRRRWEREQERIRAEKLEQTLQHSQALLAQQRGEGEADSDIEMDDNSSTGVEEGSDADAEDEDDDEESNMDSEDEDEEDEEGMSEEAIAAYEAKRKAELEAEQQGLQEAEPPDKVDESTMDDSNLPDFQANGEPSTVPGQVDAAGDANAMEVEHAPQTRGHGLSALLLDGDDDDDHMSSDESADMDSEDYDSDEDMSSTGDEAGNDNNDDEEEDNDDDVSDAGKLPSNLQDSLLGFYTKEDLFKEKDGGLPTPMTSVENGGDNDNPRPQSEARSDRQAAAGAAGDGKDVTSSMEDPKCVADKSTSTLAEVGDVEAESQDIEEVPRTPNLPESGHTRALVPVPTLLRGTLRSYQHAGMDWLASLYRNRTNGILADEMGLGKTIQTISLLAHLAEVHEVWEPHLVVVPTSVILNWVTEFQKFLPGFRVLGYYGTAEERAFKRKGWVMDPHNPDRTKRGYNVIITSYNVASQDINAIRNQKWHYLILDEAHNIRNFNSQKWQLLIRLRTKARLLLTGTPLQNDLSEVWSLLTFLAAGGDEESSAGALDDFLQNWKDPVKEIFDQGVQKISDKAQRVIDQLHISLRPFLLRRKKDDVEKDLPKKIERVVVCKLSKRQRQLYQDYMGLASTRDTLAKGSGVQAGAVLLSLRKVCNHPDLFDPRPIQTSFAMDYSPLEGYSECEQLIRRMLGWRQDTPTNLLIANNTALRKSATNRSRQLAVGSELKRQLNELDAVAVDSNPDPSTVAGSRALQRLRLRERKIQQLRSCIQATEAALENEPLIPVDLREIVTVNRGRPYIFKPKQNPLTKSWYGQPRLGQRPLHFEHLSDWLAAGDTGFQRDVATLDSYAEKMKEVIVRFAFVPPAATVPILDYAIPPKVQSAIRASPLYPVDQDFGHEARVRSSIAFPDKRLLIYDAGKLQRLTHLLRDLQSRGSRSLIFTQMTGTLDVLERFLSLMNLPYLRLDGSTPVERRQLYSSEFNRPDCKYQCMILSSRAGGVGLNLTGASSVIFYDLDWNPQMDRQCMDRAHRIGQTKDVEVYKLVSEKTVEENILRRANQKSLLDQTVIQDGHFTTEYQLKPSPDEKDDEVEGAIEALLGGNDEATTAALASVEDKEDVQAAVQASKEDRTDDVDFGKDSSRGHSKNNTPGPGAAEPEDEIEEERKGHVDLYMIKHMENLLQGWVYTPPAARLDKHGRDRSHRPKKRNR